MKFYNIIITNNGIEYNGIILVDSNNLIYGTCTYENGKKAKLSGNINKNNIVIYIEEENLLIPIIASHNYEVITDAEFVYTGKSLETADSIIEITSFDKIKKDLINNTKIRTCLNCYYGRYALSDNEDNMWCELNEFGSNSNIGPNYVCSEHIFCDESNEMDEKDYKMKQKIKEYKRNLKF